MKVTSLMRIDSQYVVNPSMCFRQDFFLFLSIWLSNSYCPYIMKFLWYLHYILTIFENKNISKRQFLLPWVHNSMTIKLISYRSEFWGLRRKSASYFQNGYFFKIIWWSREPHNKGICRWKNEIISECFIINNHGFSFVSFSIDHTLHKIYQF